MFKPKPRKSADVLPICGVFTASLSQRAPCRTTYTSNNTHIPNHIQIQLSHDLNLPGIHWLSSCFCFGRSMIISASLSMWGHTFGRLPMFGLFGLGFHWPFALWNGLFYSNWIRHVTEHNWKKSKKKKERKDQVDALKTSSTCLQNIPQADQKRQSKRLKSVVKVRSTGAVTSSGILASESACRRKFWL